MRKQQEEALAKQQQWTDNFFADKAKKEAEAEEERKRENAPERLEEKYDAGELNAQ